MSRLRHQDLAAVLRRAPHARRERARELLDLWWGHAADGGEVDLADPSTAWLFLAVLRGELPEAVEVVRLVDAAAEHGPGPACADVLRTIEGRPSTTRPVQVLSGRVTVDVQRSFESASPTGIPRVVTELVTRWVRDHDVVPLGGDARMTTMLLRPQQPGLPVPDDAAVVVPWRGVHVVPELAPETPRSSRLAALARFSHCRVGIVGHDCLPLTMAETVTPGFSIAFCHFLAAVRSAHRLVAVSEAAAAEFASWAAMAEAGGARAPSVRAVPLADQALSLDAGLTPGLALDLRVGGLPVVLCVGSHEPRKNHLVVLEAAERLWRDGCAFHLVLVGGAGWRGERFAEQVRRLRAAGRALTTLTSVDDSGLAAAYAEARFTVFPSLSEGFGLPVVESLAAGTPVVTTRYGSTAASARHGGALLVDPRDPDDLARAMRRLLVDDGLLDELRRATGAPVRTWDRYAEEVWEALVE